MMKRRYFLIFPWFLIISCGLSSLDRAFGKSDAPLQEEGTHTVKEIKKQIEEKIQKEMGNVSFNIYLDSSPKRLQNLEEGTFSLQDVHFNPESKRFTAKIVFNQEGKAALRVQGHVACLEKIPVSSRLLAPGDVITEDDIQWVETDRAGILNRAASWGVLKGATPRRPIEPGKIIQAQDIQKPICVEAGDMVSVVYHKNGLTMRTLVKALESGAKGDMIRVQNQETKKIFSVKIENNHETKVLVMTGK